ncbi:hypothetical protein A6M14_09285 [Acinetobacter sp. Ac_877]|uniref:YadA family autotransporter adhesin n=1 Tax=Acinetobacter portensis TaxID=1839785 RepID=UPI00128B1DC9|nr:YadA-like family protein [Acinetobacter portensis]MPW41661.1 hypothetical protein [Acinetobacter portensis]
MIASKITRIIVLSFCAFINFEINAAIQTGPLSSLGGPNLSEGSICITDQPSPSLTTATCIKPTTNGLTISSQHSVSSSTIQDTINGNQIAQITSEYIELGKDSKALNNGDVALGNNSKTRAVSSSTPVTLAGTTYNYAGSNPTNAVSVGNSNNERVIQNVAAGQISATSTDAINGSQLYAAYNAIESIYQRQMAGYDSEIKQINQDIDQLKEGAYAGIAGAMAIGNLPQPSTPGKNMISGGMGTYKGHSAAAFGFSSVTENDKVIWKIGASFDSNRNSGGAASIGYQW